MLSMTAHIHVCVQQPVSRLSSLPLFLTAAKAVAVLLASSRGKTTGAHLEDRTW